jgi:hypothetical protein
MFHPRALNTPVIRISAPGLFSTSTEIVCSIARRPSPRDFPMIRPDYTAAAFGGPSTISSIAAPAGTIG